MSRAMLTLAAVTAVLLAMLAGCQGGKKADLPVVTLEPGLTCVDSLVGGGAEVKDGDFVLAVFTGAVLENGVRGTMLSGAGGDTVAFQVGGGSVFPGLEKGLVGMRVGGNRALTIGPEHAFGAEGRQPLIPPAATLAFGVRILDMPKVEVQITQEGTGPACAKGDQIAVHYTGSLWTNGAVGTKFDSSLDRGQPIRFTLGQGMVIPGWDQGLTGMKVGTKARLIIPSALGYGKRGTPGGPIPPDSDLVFDVELMEIAAK